MAELVNPQIYNPGVDISSLASCWPMSCEKWRRDLLYCKGQRKKKFWIKNSLFSPIGYEIYA